MPTVEVEVEEEKEVGNWNNFPLEFDVLGFGFWDGIGFAFWVGRLDGGWGPEFAALTRAGLPI